jgi:hypothetical protein
MRRVRLLPLIVAAAGSFACSDSAFAPERGRVAGTYTLVQVRGNPLPVGYQAPAGGGVFVDGGTLTLGADGRYTLRIEQRLVMGATQPLFAEPSGAYTYSPADSSLTLTDEATQTASTGTVSSSGRVALRVGGAPFTFVRR